MRRFISWLLRIFSYNDRNFRSISGRIFIKCLFYPFFLIRISTCCYYILLFTCNWSLYIFTDSASMVVNTFPILKILIFKAFLFWSKHYSHFMFWTFIASSAWNSWFGEIHYIKCIKLSFLSTLNSKMEPLLMTTSICINLHK